MKKTIIKSLSYKFVTTCLILSLISGGIFAQNQVFKPINVKTPAYYDKTPPLRDMKVILPGERKREWKNNIIANPSVKPQFLVDNTKGNITEAVQTIDGTKDSRGPVVTFDGVHNKNGVAPPDTDGEVGPNHFFQMVNLSFGIYSKSGELLYGPVDNSTLWDGFAGAWASTNDGDPVIMYDELADRWIATQFAVNCPNGKYYELIAVSASGDPLGEYYRYAYEFDDMNDYPKLSIWPDAYYCTYNMFDGKGYAGVVISAYDREKMLAGDPNAATVEFGYFTDKFSMLSADADGPIAPPVNSPGYIIGFGNSNKLEVYEVELDWDTPTNSTYTYSTSLDVSSFNSYFANGIPQKGTGQALDALSSMIMYRLQYRNFPDYESMVTNHTVNVGGTAAIRWYELRKTTGDWELYQEGTFAPDSENRWMGSIAQNGKGTIAVGYSVSSSNTYPSIRYAGRSINAPLGTFNLMEQEIYTGTTSQTGINRWGDYSCMSVDPVNDSTFWFTTEYTKGGWNWRTKIAAFDFGETLPPTLSLEDTDTICDSQLYPCNPEYTYAISASWTTSGDGNFNSPNTFSPNYIRGMGDIENGFVWLKIIIQGYDGTSLSDSVKVVFSPAPTSYAGPNQTVAAWGSTQLAGETTYADSVLWTTAGDGVFDDDHSLTAIYTQGDEDREDGSVKLKLTAYSVAPCHTTEYDKITIYFDPTLTVEEDKVINSSITVIPNPVTDIFTVKIDEVKNGDASLTIFNQQGKQIFGSKIKITDNNYEKSFDISKYPAGIYFIKVISNNKVLDGKLIKQ